MPPDATDALQAYVHVARLEMPAAADRRAPGGAITVALCGATDHAPPCPLAAHYIGLQEDDTSVALRILFTTTPSQEEGVRVRIRRALASGTFVGPDGVASAGDSWTTVPRRCSPTSMTTRSACGSRPRCRSDITSGGTEGGTRTHKRLPSAVFETAAYAIPPLRPGQPHGTASSREPGSGQRRLPGRRC
jgi:hypothetical protein